MIVNVSPQLPLLLDDAGPGVAEDRAAHCRHPAQLGPGEDTHWTSEAEAHHGPHQGEAGHGDLGVGAGLPGDRGRLTSFTGQPLSPGARCSMKQGT